MSKPKTSILWTLSKEKLQDLINSFDTFSAILRELNMCAAGGNLKTLRKVFDYYNLNYSKFSTGLNHYKGKSINIIKISDKDLFIKNSIHSRNVVKSRIIKKNLIPYECDICGQKPFWNDKELVLVLDHINGINNDHRLENLRFLCPNCNSQQETFCGKHNSKRKLKKKEKRALDIINQKDIDEKINRIKCYNVDFSKYGWINEIAKLENCSHTSIRRFFKKYMNDFYNACYHRKNQY